MDRHEEFLRLFLKSELEIRAFTRSLVRDWHACDDVFQDVALTLWKEFDRYDASRSFAAWARGVAANKILQRWDKVSRVPVPFSPDAIQAISDAYDRSEAAAPHQAEALQHCLQRLPEKSRRLLILRYERSFKLDAIARELGATLDAIAQALSRLRSRLRKCMIDWLAARGDA
jgi:RNA polymerase sigma-70 factor (ECF subfamily)